jgi:hypothetical protein
MPSDPRLCGMKPRAIYSYGMQASTKKARDINDG